MAESLEIQRADTSPEMQFQGERAFFLSRANLRMFANHSDRGLITRAMVMGRSYRMYRFYLCRHLMFDIMEHCGQMSDAVTALCQTLTDLSDWQYVLDEAFHYLGLTGEHGLPEDDPKIQNFKLFAINLRYDNQRRFHQYFEFLKKSNMVRPLAICYALAMTVETIQEHFCPMLKMLDVRMYLQYSSVHDYHVPPFQ